MTTRRDFLFQAGTGLLSLAVLTSPLTLIRLSHTEETFEIMKTNTEWKKILTPAQYRVLREHETEASGSSPLNHETRSGTYACAACDLPLYSSKTKFDSGTGWPSFYAPLDNAVGTSTDWKIIYPRTEVHCRRCGGHLGHVFDDGPPPTGKRYCMNGIAMIFTPTNTQG